MIHIYKIIVLAATVLQEKTINYFTYNKNWCIAIVIRLSKAWPCAMANCEVTVSKHVNSATLYMCMYQVRNWFNCSTFYLLSFFFFNVIFINETLRLFLIGSIFSYRTLYNWLIRYGYCSLLKSVKWQADVFS